MLEGKTMLEFSPPGKRATKETVHNTVEKTAALMNTLENVDYINIPEIVTENHLGQPFYEKLDAKEYGIMLREATGKELVINKVVVHLPQNAFCNWLQKAIESNIRYAVLVGGSSRFTKYPGLRVTEANNLAKEKITIGNITIPNRENEVQRLTLKTETGCSFFTTQILFEADTLKKLLSDYHNECKKKSLKPAAFVLCFAPASDALDIEYMKWLGANIPHETEAKLKQDKLSKTTISLAKQIYQEVLDYRKEKKLNTPISVNVEPIALHNLPLAKELTEALKQVRQATS